MIQVFAELLIIPTGLAAATQLAPRGSGSQLLALWFLGTAVGDAIGGQLARLVPVLGDITYYLVIGGAAIALAAIFVTQGRKISALMGGVH